MAGRTAALLIRLVQHEPLPVFARHNRSYPRRLRLASCAKICSLVLTSRDRQRESIISIFTTTATTREAPQS